MTDMEKFNMTKDNPVFNALCKAFGVSEEDLENYRKSLEKDVDKPEEKPVYNEEKCTPVDVDVDEYEDYEVSDDEHVAILSKDDVEAILREWRKIEKDVFALDRDYGICLWNSSKETVYNRYNKMIKMFLEMSFGEEIVDIMEDWAFGYNDSDRPSFDSLWENIVVNKD